MEKSNHKSSTIYIYSFEDTMRQFFGKKAYQLGFGNEEIVKKWLIKSTKKMIKLINNVETTTRHKESLMRELQNLESQLSEKQINMWSVIFNLFFLCSRFLGFDYLQGMCLNTPFYFQTKNQKFWQNLCEGTDVYDDKNYIKTRRDIVLDLYAKNYRTFDIGLILNISEKDVLKLKKMVYI